MVLQSFNLLIILRAIVKDRVMNSFFSLRGGVVCRFLTATIVES